MPTMCKNAASEKGTFCLHGLQGKMSGPMDRTDFSGPPLPFSNVSPAKHCFPELSTVTNTANWLIPSFPILIHNSIKKWCNQVGVPLSLGGGARSTRLWRTLFWFCKKTLSVFIFSWKGLSGRILKVPREVMHLRNICSFKQTLTYLSDWLFLDSNRRVAQ